MLKRSVEHDSTVGLWPVHVSCAVTFELTVQCLRRYAVEFTVRLASRETVGDGPGRASDFGVVRLGITALPRNFVLARELCTARLLLSWTYPIR